MDRKIIKRIALNLVVFQLFSTNALSLTKNKQHNNKNAKINYTNYVFCYYFMHSNFFTNII